MCKLNQEYLSNLSFCTNPVGIRPTQVLTLAFLLTGCAGKVADPIKVTQITDKDLTCSQILSQLDALDSVGRELERKSEKLPKNAALATAGSLLVVPYLFMDLKNGEKVELNAVRARHMHLTRLYQKKSC